MCPVRRARYSTRDVLPLLVGPCKGGRRQQSLQAVGRGCATHAPQLLKFYG